MLNREKFKTAEVRAKEFGKWCEKHKIFDSYGNTACAWRCVFCHFAWLDLEAEEEKIEDCPYCGGSCLVSNGAVGKYRVFCEKNLSCMYSSGSYITEHEAIASHNRMARAVMAAGKKEETP